MSLGAGEKNPMWETSLSLGHSLELEVRDLVATDMDILTEFCVPNRARVEGSGQVVVCASRSRKCHRQ